MRKMLKKFTLVLFAAAVVGACAQNPYEACRNAVDREYCLRAHMYERNKWNALGAAGTNLYNQSQETNRARIYSQGNALSGQHGNHLYRYHGLGTHYGW